MSRAFFKVLIDGQRQAERVAADLRMSVLWLKGALLQMWEDTWRREIDELSTDTIGSYFRDSDHDVDDVALVRIVGSLVRFGFLEPHSGGTLVRVRGAAELHGFAARKAKREKSQTNGTKGGRPKKKPNPADARKNPDVTQKNPDVTETKPKGNPAETIEYRDIESREDHDLISHLDGLLFASAAEKPISKRTQGLAAEDSAPAQPGENAASGDHVAREGVDGFQTPSQAAKGIDVVARFVKTLRGNTPPEPLAAPPLNERLESKAEAPPTPTPAVSQPRPPETKPMEPAVAPLPAATSSTPAPNPVREKEKAGQAGKSNDISALAGSLSAIFQEVRGSSYKWEMASDMVALRDVYAASSVEEVERRWRLGLGADGFHRVSTVRELGRKWNDLAGLQQAKKQPHPEDGMLKSTNTETIAEDIWQDAAKRLGYGPEWETDQLKLSAVTTVARELAWGKPADLARILRAFGVGVEA